MLRDLGAGADINQAIAAHTEPMPELEKEFAAYARKRADELAPGLDWRRPGSELLEPGAAQELAVWARQNPDNYWALRTQARDLIEAKKYSEAKPVLARFIGLYPRPDGVRQRLPAARRGAPRPRRNRPGAGCAGETCRDG